MRYGEVVHFSHPHHRLRLEHADTPFRCDGCREVGIGARFRCPFAGCDHDLHRQCALPLSPPPPPLRHPFYPRCAFVFLARAPGAPGTRYCNACGRDVAGFVYHCRACGFDLHPCCATLPHVLDAAAGAASGGGGRRREAVPAPEGDGGVPPVRAPGAELDVPEQLQELQPPRGVRHGHARRELERRRPPQGRRRRRRQCVRRRDGGGERRVQGAGDTRRGEEQPREQGRVLLGKEGEGEAVLRDRRLRGAGGHLRRARRPHRPHRRRHRLAHRAVTGAAAAAFAPRRRGVKKKCKLTTTCTHVRSPRGRI
ncbi:Os12g0596300 [Oryza sativa Japonica Group]|uniref:Os12g0596300 protein n=2 Tax=Oryza sativa subsp. japonica TaxID=39947 RepID=C7JA40_ORYSJ|nr:Os12g0596300 [Oryza sativa Japonica Group]BAT17923.1 Os12g0596300 [Oryza sativa Japonica Group]|eukprot:NP_001177044.1 Os12g0596300 [Oryza sativa Japonica Group]